MIPRRLLAALFAAFALAILAHRNGRAEEPPSRTDLHGDPLPVGASIRLGTVRWRAPQGVSQMAFVPGGQNLVTTGWKSLSVWDVDTGRVVRTISTDGTPEGEGFLYGFAFTPDGKLLFSADYLAKTAPVAMGDRNTRLYLWEYSSGKVLAQVDLGIDASIRALRPDGRMAACATFLGDVFLWDLEQNEVRHIVPGDRRTTIEDVRFAGEGKHLVVLQKEGSLCQRIDVASGELLNQVELDSPGRVALSPSGDLLGAYYHPDGLFLHDTSTGQKRRLPLKEQVNYLDLSFSPDGRTLLAMDRRAEVVQFWAVAKGQLHQQLQVPGLAWTGHDTELLLSGDGKTLASRAEHGVVRLWDARTGRPRLHLPGHASPPVDLAFSADGKEVVSYGHRGDSFGGELYRWDATTGKSLAHVSPDGPNGCSSSFMDWRLAPGGRQLAERADGGTYLYEVSSGKRLPLGGEALAPADWTFTPDGRAAVTIGAGQEICLWDVSTGKLRRKLGLETNGKTISWLRFTPDGRLLATGEEWGKVHLWDAASGQHRTTLTLPAEREPYQKPLDKWQIAFTPDGRYLFASNTTNLWVWDFVARREIGPFETDEHPWSIGGSGRVAVSPDGRLLAWFDPAWKLRLYEICTGKIVYRFQEDYSSMAFAPTAWRLATGCKADSSVLIWDLPLLFRSESSRDQGTSPEALWAVLKADDAVQAYRALWRLAALPEADAFLARQLQPVEGVPPPRLRSLLADLGSPEFERREQAEKDLAAAGDAVRAALIEASTKTEDAEVRRRVERLQERLQARAPERLREARALMAVEARGTMEARRLLQRLAAGLSEARLTQGARDALERLPK
jgi:WD40 repeat protein